MALEPSETVSDVAASELRCETFFIAELETRLS